MMIYGKTFYENFTPDSLSLIVRTKKLLGGGGGVIFWMKNCEKLLHRKSPLHFFCKKLAVFFFMYDTFENLTSR